MAEPPQREKCRGEQGRRCFETHVRAHESRAAVAKSRDVGPERKLTRSLGRRFRHHIWSELTLSINGARVEAFDPLCLDARCERHGAEPFGEPLSFWVAERAGGELREVTARFSVLPIAQWAHLSPKEKRALGITKGAGVSVVRSGREVDYGWFFLSAKRRENYDDWWRCEVSFDPALDEQFGLTHSKQQIKPSQELLELLSPHISATAKALSRYVRGRHAALKSEQPGVTPPAHDSPVSPKSTASSIISSPSVTSSTMSGSPHPSAPASPLSGERIDIASRWRGWRAVRDPLVIDKAGAPPISSLSLSGERRLVFSGALRDALEAADTASLSALIQSLALSALEVSSSLNPERGEAELLDALNRVLSREV